MAKLRIVQQCVEELEELKEDLPKLYEKVNEDLDLLAHYGYKSVVEPGRPPHTETFKQGVRYVKTRQAKNQYRVYFFLTGDYVVCLLGWNKKRNDISKGIEDKIEKRYETYKQYFKR